MTCATSLHSIGQEQSTYEHIVEKSTLEYFQQLLDVSEERLLLLLTYDW